MNNGYGPPSFYNGPPPMDPNYRGPPPMPGYGYPGPGFNGPPPGEFYPPRSGPPGAYVGPNGYPGPPPQHYGGPPPPPGRGNGRFDGPPPRSAGAPYHPPAPHHSPHNAHSAPPTGMSPPYGQDYQQQPPPAQSEEQVPFVKPEPVEASLDNFTPTTSAAAPMRQPPVDFFKSTSLDDRNGEATPTHGANSGWGAPQAANGGEQSTFRPYQSIMSMRR